VLQIDLIKSLTRSGVRALIVARSGLGTINHTLLTIEALELRGIGVAGVVMVGAPDMENRRAIERFGGVAVVGELPPFDPLTPEALCRWATESLDRSGHLTEFLK
jgi:dethiobiotin synthetase